MSATGRPKRDFLLGGTGAKRQEGNMNSPGRECASRAGGAREFA